MSYGKTIFECPAYKVIDQTGRKFRDGDTLAIAYTSQRHGTLHHIYTLGSVAGYAVHNGDDVECALKRARDNGHELFWANQNATILSNMRKPQEVHACVQHGDIIRAFGRYFSIVKTPNNNIALLEVAMTEEEFIERTKAHFANQG